MAGNCATSNSQYDRLKELKEFDESKMGVKGLSDSGITSIPRFFIHPPETLPCKNLNSSTNAASSIPLLDLANLYSPTHRPKIIQQIKEAASTWGFFQVINHGIPASILDETIGSITAFHEQPHEIKADHYRRQEHHGVMYTSNNDLYRSKAATWHDSLQVFTAPEEMKVEEDIPEICRKEVITWDFHASKVAEALFELLAEGLGLEAGKFKELGFMKARLFLGHCYPYCPQPDLTVGIKSHTDAGLTVLLQNQVGGLQVKHGNEWVDVKPLPGALTVNIGDFIQIISNGKYQSVEHRVLANSSKEPRISVLIFNNVGGWKESDEFGPLPELLSAEKPALYRGFTVPEFLQSFYSKGLDGKNIVERVTLH
ncbi:hypothetical protein ACLB2K_050881 [Fragaria x ananassa]